MQCAACLPWQLQSEATVPPSELLIHSWILSHLVAPLAQQLVLEQARCGGLFQAAYLLSEARVSAPPAAGGLRHRSAGLRLQRASWDKVLGAERATRAAPASWASRGEGRKVCVVPREGSPAEEVPVS